VNPNEREPIVAAPPAEGEVAPARTANFLQVMAAVFSGFLGIRKKASGERDLVTIKPVHVIAAGLLGAALFVATLIILVKFVIGA
jgi:uncharacterized membrane protein